MKAKSRNYGALKSNHISQIPKYRSLHDTHKSLQHHVLKFCNSRTKPKFQTLRNKPSTKRSFFTHQTMIYSLTLTPPKSISTYTIHNQNIECNIQKKKKKKNTKLQNTIRTYGLSPRHDSHIIGKSDRSHPSASASLSSLCAILSRS